MVNVLLILSVLLLSASGYAEEPATCDAVCRYPIEKAQEDRRAIEAGKAAVQRWEERQRLELERERLALQDASRIMQMRYLMPPPMLFSCTSMQLGPFTNLDCF